MTNNELLLVISAFFLRRDHHRICSHGAGRIFHRLENLTGHLVRGRRRQRDQAVRALQGRSQDFSKGASQRLLTRSPSGDRRLYMVYIAALPRVSAGSVVLSRHEGPY